MFFYLKILERFLTSTLLSKDEYNVNSKHFNPLRLIVVGFLTLNLFFSVFLMAEMLSIHDKLSTSCPGVLEEIKKEKTVKIE